MRACRFEFSIAIDVFNDGANVIQVPFEGELIDMVVAGKEAAENLTTKSLKDIPIVTKLGNILRVEQLAKIEVISAHLNKFDDSAGGEQYQSDCVQRRHCRWKMWSKSLIPKFCHQSETIVSIAVSAIKLEGAASALAMTWAAMQANVLTAIIIIFCFWQFCFVILFCQ